jgi:transposase
LNKITGKIKTVQKLAKSKQTSQAMQGKKIYTEKLFSSFQLSERVPKNNFYRQLKEQLDLKFLSGATAKYYGTEGQQSIDPVVFFKLVLVGYLENLNSDRKIIAHAQMRLDIIYFIGYDIDEELPWHSTLSRTRQLYGEEVFLQLFRQVLKLCIDKGMVSGRRQAIDSAYIKANASLSSLIEKEVMDDAQTYSEELETNEEDGLKKKTISYLRKKKVAQHHAWKAKQYEGQHKMSKELLRSEEAHRPKFLSNHTHYSPTDPDARISVKPGKQRQLNYSAQTAVDTAHHVITGIQADYSDKRDSQSLKQVLEQTEENLKANGIQLEEVLADSGYSSGTALRYLEEQNITGYIPNFGKYKPEREGFIYNKEKDQYECLRGNKAILPYKSTSTDPLGFKKKSYRSSSKICKTCALRKLCIGQSSYKKIDDSIYKPEYDRMHQHMQSRHAKRMMRLRSSTVEPVLGTLINFTGMRRIWTRGIKQANKFMICAAIAYNLKKYMRFIKRQRISACDAIKKQAILTKQGRLLTISGFRHPIVRYSTLFFSIPIQRHKK